MTENSKHYFVRGRPLRLVLLTWVGVYPILTLIALLADWALPTWPVWTKTLLMSTIMVPTLVLIIMPILERRCRVQLTGRAMAQHLSTRQPITTHADSDSE